MTIMGFSRLLKVLSENTDRRLKLLEEYFVPQTDDSYYDFHASMKRSARQVCDGASDFPLEMRVFRIPCHWHSLNIQHVV